MLCEASHNTAKTTTTAHLGIGLAIQGKKVLLIDADPQGDLTTALGWPDNDSLPVTLATVMEKIIHEQEINYYDGILRHKEGVDLMPSNIELSGMEMNLVSTLSREYTLRDYLNMIKHEYDYVLIDCMPSLGMITINALAAADSVIVPVQPQYLPAKGMTQLIKTIGKVKKQINPYLTIDGILLNLADMRTNLARLTAETLYAQYGKALQIYQTQIPVAVKAAETSAVGKSIFTYDKNSKVSLAYKAFAKEVLADGERTHIQSSLSR